MADFLNMSINTYTKIELGDRSPSLKEIEIIAEKLEVEPSYFLGTSNIRIKNGDNSPGVVGYGNVVTIDKDLITALTKTLDRLSNFLDKN